LIALSEPLAVLQGERVKAEDLMQLGQLVLPGSGELEPEELVSLQVFADARFVDTG
jgi:hypothetical protein